ncbi:MAG: hypothetical protein HFI65_02420 [Lachnospiraceae bacterium]|nr:hypothetical protein [Lachnospiraceae bacterium]
MAARIWRKQREKLRSCGEKRKKKRKPNNNKRAELAAALFLKILKGAFLKEKVFEKAVSHMEKEGE